MCAIIISMPATKTQVIYRLDGVSADDGVDVFEISPVLMHFGELVRSANLLLGNEQKIDVRIKPFREGSWIADFVFQQNTVNHLLSYLKTDEGVSLLLLCNLLGISAKDGIVGLVDVIRWTKGFVTNFKKKDEKTIIYPSPTGEELEVSIATHKLVQSPVIQNNYYNSVIVPFDKFPSVASITLEVTGASAKKQVFTEADKPAFEQYARTELLEDIEANVSTLGGVFLKPKRGSYSGEEKAYSFVMGDNNILWPVTIDDEEFLQKLRSGELRLYSEDVLKVNLEISQKRDSTNKVLTTYAVKKVIEYIKYEKPKQLGLI